MLGGRGGLENNVQNIDSSTKDEPSTTSSDLDDEIPF
jgi:hypothetical protein